jgi:hypothetical protein
MNRGNDRAAVFHKPQDYEAFLSLPAEAKKRHGVELFGSCLRPNHFHLASVRECLNRQRSFGKLDWQAEMASRFGLNSTLRPRGRPWSEKKSSLSPFMPLMGVSNEDRL